jgi:hypothetical protein
MTPAATIAGAEKAGGANRDRTGDLLHAMQALSQLSYSPKPQDRQGWYPPKFRLISRLHENCKDV